MERVGSTAFGKDAETSDSPIGMTSGIRHVGSWMCSSWTLLSRKTASQWYRRISFGARWSPGYGGERAGEDGCACLQRSFFSKSGSAASGQGCCDAFVDLQNRRMGVVAARTRMTFTERPRQAMGARRSCAV